MKHLKGKWHWEGLTLRDEVNKIVLTHPPTSTQGDRELIANAPQTKEEHTKMYEALKLIADVLSNYHEGQPKNQDYVNTLLTGIDNKAKDIINQIEKE